MQWSRISDQIAGCCFLKNNIFSLLLQKWSLLLLLYLIIIQISLHKCINEFPIRRNCLTLERHIVGKAQLINFNIAERKTKKGKGVGAVVVVNTLNADGYFGSSVKLHPSRQRYSKKKRRKRPTGTERPYNRAKNKAAHYTQAVHNEYSLRSNESRCSNASCRQIAALKREKCRPTEKMRKTGNTRPVEFRRISRWRYLFFSPTSSASSFIIAYANIRSPAPTLLTISFFSRVTESNVAAWPTRSCLNCWKINWNVDGSSKWKVNIDETRFQRIF